MHKILCICCGILLTLPANVKQVSAQSVTNQPELGNTDRYPARKYLAQLPPFPDNICSIKEPEENAFRNGILTVVEAIGDEVLRIERQQPTQQQMTKSLSEESGISTNELNRLAENGDEEDGERLMEQKLKDEYGITLAEVDNLENMSEAEQKQWAENAAKNRANTTEGKSALAEDQIMVNLNNRMEELVGEITAYQTKWASMEHELSKQEKQAREELDVCMQRVKNGAPEPKYQGEHCTNQKAIDEYFKYNEPPCHQAYCQRISPLKMHNLERKRADLYKMFVLFEELQTIQNEMLERQTGINLNTTESPAIGALTLVREYAYDMYDSL